MNASIFSDIVLTFIRRTALIFFICVFVTSCSIFTKSKISQICTELQSVSNLNPDIEKSPSPIVINFYQLKSDKNFSNAEYYQLSSQPDKTLGKDLVEQSQIILRPQQRVCICHTLSPDTQFLGITGEYRLIAVAAWKEIITIDQNTKPHYKVVIGSERIDIDK